VAEPCILNREEPCHCHDSSGTTTYAWDYENRLTSATLPGGAGVVTFKYDPFGRRIQKSSASGTTNYTYDGESIVVEYDAGGVLIAKYAQGIGIDEPLAMWRGGAVSYYHADGLGSVTSLTDGSGSAVAAYATDAFGKSIASAGAVINAFRYTGREWDQETALYYYRARYYDPAIGRFLSEDPITFEEGTNFYRYVDNSPVDWADSFGLAKCTYSIKERILRCRPDNPKNKPVVIPVSSGNNGDGLQCKDNPECTRKRDRGPIPQGEWEWTKGYTAKANGRVLRPRPGTNTYDRDFDLFRSHSCENPFGPAKGPKFCSEGCITGLPRDIRKLNRLLDAEPGSTVMVTD
jgi:RHS repeat-associated protein